MSTFRRSDRLVGTELSESGYVILDPASSRYFQLNEVGRAIWELLERPATEEEIVEALVQRYEIAPADCAREIAAFLDRLVREGVVVHD